MRALFGVYCCEGEDFSPDGLTNKAAAAAALFFVFAGRVYHEMCFFVCFYCVFWEPALEVVLAPGDVKLSEVRAA